MRRFRKPKLQRHALSTLRVPGVYVLFRGEVAVYVGQSQDVYQRIREHAYPTSKSKHAFRGGFDHFSVITRESLENRLKLEKYLISAFRPEGNKTMEGKSRLAFMEILSDPAFAPTVHTPPTKRTTEKVT